MRYKLLFVLFFSWALSNKHYAQTVCSQAQPVCAGIQNIFPGQTTGAAQIGPDYSCLNSQPNPSWHSFEVGISGSFIVTISGSANGDVDYICYGPFSSTSTACSSLSSGTNIVGCSYSGSSIETLTFNGIAGQFYILLVTNYSGANQSVVISQTSGTGGLNCSNVCDITGITSTVSSCSSSNTYSVSGTVSVNGVPTVGSLTITNTCSGSTQVFNAPFASPITYSFTNLTATGAACNITARFQALTTCSLTTGYVAPSVPTVFISASDNPLCIPNPSASTLTAVGSGSTYTWSTGSNSGSIAVSPPIGTSNFNVTTANSSGCSASAAITMTVSQTPTVSAFAIPGFLCSGSPATLVATALGAAGFTWQPGSLVGNTVVVTPSVSAGYTVTGVQGVCSSTAATAVTVISGPSMIVSTSSPTICPGNIATLSAIGAISYTWFPGGIVAPSITVAPTTSTTYSVVGMNAFGCTATTTILQSVSIPPTVQISPVSPSLCAGTSISLIASGATAYTWNPGNINSTSILISPTSNSTYTLIGSDGICTNSAVTTVTVVAVPIVNASSSSPTVCLGLPVSLLASGAINYTWVPGNLNGTPVSVTPTANTIYTLTGEANGCSSTATTAITVINNPTLNVTSTPAAICPGGSFTLNITGAASYTWNPGGSNLSTLVVNPTSTTIYSVTGANVSGCLTTATVNLVVNPAPALIVSASSSTICAGSSTTLNASGAAGFTWNPGGSNLATIVVTPSITTTYTVVGANAFGCTSQSTIDIIVIPIPIVGAGSSPATICSGDIATLTGSGAIFYTWQPGGLAGTSVTVAPTSNTTYTVTGFSSGCSNTAIVTVAVNSAPTLIVSASPATVCPGNSSNLSASGAISFTWSPVGLNGANINVTPAGTTVYTATGTNASGCTGTNTVMVTVSTPPSLILSASSSTICAGSSTTLNASGAAGFTWNPGGSNLATIVVTPSITTTYTVVGANAFGCTSQSTIDIIVIPIPTVGAGSSPATICSGDIATLTGSGATFYTWQPGGLSGTSVTVAPTSNTTYTVTGLSSGCSNTAIVTVAVNSAPTILISASPASICPGGSSTLTIGGSAISFTWVNGSTIAVVGGNFIATPPVTTTYTLSGTNAAGCISSSVVTIVVNTPPAVLASASSSSVCAGGSVTLTASGAVTYTWNPTGSTNINVAVTPSISTTYTLTGANSAGCTGQNTVAITVVPLPVVGASSSPTAICSGSTATLTAFGATNYTWIPGGQLTSIITVAPTSNTTYSIIGNTAGCTNTGVVSVIVNPVPSLILSASPATVCPGNSSALSASGASSYTWNPTGLTGSPVVVTPTSTTIYTATGTNVFGCTATNTVVVTLTSPPTVVASASSPSVCAGSNVTLTASGAATYTWLPGGSNNTVIVVSPSSSITYTLLGFNGASCGALNTVAITVVPVPIVSAGSSPATICSGSTSTLTGSGASSYLWNPGALTGTSVIVAPTSNITYTVIGTTSGCSGAPAFVSVAVNSRPNLIASAAPSSICAGSSASLLASGATSYTWNPGNIITASTVVTPPSTTIYTVTGANLSGCTTVSFVTVVVTPIPALIITATPGRTVCSGSQLTLTASGATNYTWNPGNINGNTFTTTANGNNTFLTYTTFASTSGCTTQAVTSVLVLSVTAQALPSSICPGSSATLSASGPFSTYNWNPGPVTGQTVAVTPGSSTIYTVIAQGSAISCSNTAAVFVNSAASVTIFASQAPICTGSSATLTAGGALNYTWQPGGSTATAIVVAPSTTTIYSLTGSNGSGCTGTTVFVLPVSSPPPITATTASPTICQGFTATLTASGAASSSNYTWNPGGGMGSVVTVTPATNTTYTVTSNNGICTSSAVVAVTVVSAPIMMATANPTSMCSGGTVTLSASGAVSYTWLPTFTVGATVTDIPANTITYTVLGLGSSGCTNSAVASVTVFTSPTVAVSPAAPAVCAGSTATLTPSGATSYTLNPGGLTSTGGAFTVNPGATTSYTLIGDNGGCASGSHVFNLTVNPLPVIAATSTPTTICSGQPVNLTASGGVSYTWNPTGSTGASITDTPAASVLYTVNAQDANGCLGNATVNVNVNLPPSITIVSTASAVCQGGTVSLTANGGATYTWNPGGSNSSVITDTPAVTTIYSVSSEDLSNACTGTATISIAVVPIPTLNVTPVHSSVCSGSSATLTATGATSYTWLPSGTISSVTVETPTGTITNYTVIGDNGGNCPATFTVDVVVIPLPDNVVATANGTISCTSPSLEIDGSSTSTDISYSWTGPSSFTSGIQNPTVTAWGVYTLAVTNTITGCVATATVDVPTDGSIPSVTATTSGSITCLTNSVTLNAITTTTNAGYAWMGPAGFTSTLQTFTVSAPGDYTVVVVDLTSTCRTSETITVGTHTNVSITATIIPATCNGETANNDGTILVANFGPLDKFDLVPGPSYTGTATYSLATLIPTSGIVTSNLANPTTTLAFTLRLFDSQGCTKDTVLILQPTDCVPKWLGIAKAASQPTSDFATGTYNVTYTVIVKNYGTDSLGTVLLKEDLASAFPAPTTFTVSAPVITSTNNPASPSMLMINPAFDGHLQTSLTNTVTSKIAGGHIDTLQFNVIIKTAGFFGPFRNSIDGTALSVTNGSAVQDSSFNGYDPDPDGDGNPANNSLATIIGLQPINFFGITKNGSISNKLPDNSYDLTYSVTVHNLGNDTLYNIVLKDSLFENTIKQPATYSIKTAPVADSALIANSTFDGQNDVNLTLPSTMPPGRVNTVVFVINIHPDTVTVIKNSAFGICNNRFGVALSDTSDMGDNPDSNGNGIVNEAIDNLPTLVAINNHTLFIPQGFSPDGDAINEFFVIEGLPTAGNNVFTVFNRWGNKVYYKANYDNTWEGYPNVSGIIGNQKLPQGTYYYILDMKGSGMKPATGFIVLQY